MEKININDIKPAEYNPRMISDKDYEKLQKSINTFGLVDPIIVNLKNNVIIGGHQRYKALLDENVTELQLLRMGDIGYVFHETSFNVPDEIHEKSLNLALNKISGEFVEEKLKPLLEEVNLSNLDIDVTGFDKLDLNDFEAPDIEQEPKETTEDNYNESNEDIETNIKAGDLFKLGNHYLLCGDATQKEDLQILLQHQKIDMVFTDPPYGMCLNTDWSNARTNLKFMKEKGKIKGNKYNKVVGDHNDFSSKLIKTIFDHFNYSNEIFLWGADYYSELIPDRKNGSWFVWDKRSNNETSIEEANQTDKIYGSCFELCWSKNKHKREIVRIKWAGLFGMEHEFDHKRCHPTQKPIKLSAWFIQKFSNENDIILDLFGGSGSTLIACEQLNRNCYMLEIEPKYCQVIINRWEEFTGQKAVKV